MKENFVNDLEVGKEITDFFMAKKAQIKTGSNGKDYFDVELCDKTGSVAGKKWDIEPQESNGLANIKDGEMLKVRAVVNEWQGTKQLRISRIRKANPVQDGLEMTDFVKAAPEKPEDMYDYIFGIAESLGDEDYRKLCVKILTDNKEKLMYYPAASRNHHAEFAGLLFHMKRMLMTGRKICEVYTDLNVDLVSCGVIVHDMEKLNEIESNEYGMSPGYSMEGTLLGHIVMGAKYIDQIGTEIGMPYEKMIMIEHMVVSHHYEPDYGSPKRPMFPEAEVLHYCDIMDARLFDMFDALTTAEPGGFSEKVWTLDGRRVYKPAYLNGDEEVDGAQTGADEEADGAQEDEHIISIDDYPDGILPTE